MGFFSSIFGGGGKEEEQKPSYEQSSKSYDPLQAEKNAVATPLSKFLSNNVGKGVGEFPTDPNYTNRYNEFMAQNPMEYFKTNVSDPAYAQFTKYAKPVIDEGYAGALRGSGRYGAQEAGYVGLGESLGNTAATFIPSFSQAQLSAGQTEFSRQYQNWYQGLAENNPVLSQAINFINSGRNNTESYGAVYPEQGAGLFDMLGSQGLSKTLNGLGSPTSDGGKSGLGDMLKDPKLWISIASLFAGCWVASSIFGGWSKRETIYSRVYMTCIAPEWFKKLYLQFGESFASWLDSNQSFKSVVKPLFNYFSYRGRKHLEAQSYGI